MMRTVFTAICVLFLFGATHGLHAQDRLVLRNGNSYEVKVLRSTDDEDKVKYVYPSETTIYERPKRVISYILYEDGRKEIFDERLKESERISSRPATQRPATESRSQSSGAWENVKTTFLDADVQDMTRLKRITATSSVSYKDAIQQLKKQAATLGATHVLVMDVPESDNTDEIEVIGVAFRDESLEFAPPANRPQQSKQPVAESSSNERRRRTARITENYNNNTQLILDDAPPRQRSETLSERTPPPSEEDIFADRGDTQDAVYLLSGRVVRGTIVEFDPEEFVSIRTSTGRVYEYSMEDIKRVSPGSSARSASKPSSSQAAGSRYSSSKTTGNRSSSNQAIGRQPAARDDFRYDDNRERRQKDDFYDNEYNVSGYKGIFDVGYTLSFGNAEKGRFELSTTHGYQINPYLFIGAGIGLHMYSAREASMKKNMGTDNYPQYADPKEEIKMSNTETLLPTSYEHGMDSSFMFMPTFLEIRGYLPIVNSPVSPFASIKAGYSFNLSDGFGPAGIYFAPSIGATFNISPKIGLFLNIGYTLQGLGESGTTKTGSTTTTLIRDKGYGYYYRDKEGGALFKTTTAQGVSIRLGIEF